MPINKQIKTMHDKIKSSIRYFYVFKNKTFIHEITTVSDLACVCFASATDRRIALQPIRFNNKRESTNELKLRSDPDVQ